MSVHSGIVMAAAAAEKEQSFLFGVMVWLVVIVFFGAFGYGIWRMVDPDRWLERDTSPRTTPRRSVFDMVRDVLWWVGIVLGAVAGLAFVVEFWQVSDSDGPVPEILASAGLVAGVGILVWIRLARCAETGDRIFFCRCSIHSGE